MIPAPVRVLVVLAEPPLQEGRGAGRLVLAMARGLKAHGIHVELLAARQEFAAAGHPPDDVPVEVVDVPPDLPSWRARLGRLRRPAGHIARTAFGSVVIERAQTADVLQLEEVDTAWCSEHIRLPSVLRLHYLVRWDRSLGAPWERSFRHVLEFELAERTAIRRHDNFVTSSPRVASELRRRKPSAQVEIVPPCLDPHAYPVATPAGPPVAGLVGTASWPPTRNAIERLLRDVWPAVRRRLPGARLLIAGRGTREFVADVDDGVEVLGEVPSAVEFLRRLSVLLYPLDRGSGIKVKTLESIAVGVPVVTTPLGAEGIDGGDGIVVAEGTDALADAAVAILRDPGERRERAAAARHAFERRYAPEPATEPLAELYRRIAG
jgi:glycosyltransferase involved in cell wall biosynthesis